MPIRHITPSSYVGPQVRKWRGERSQQWLVDRLRELGAVRWSQTKVHKLETGKLTNVLVDDVFELALALDVSPLYLLTPLEGHDENANAYKVLFGRDLSFWPWLVREWIRGVRPLLGSINYRDVEEARKGRRFYLLDSQPLAEWHRIEEGAKQARRIRGAATVLEPEDADGEDGDDG
jgi:hypothetical protein